MKAGLALGVSLFVAAALLPASATAGTDLNVAGSSDLTSVWNGTGDDASVEINQVYCNSCADHPDFWPGTNTYLWNFPLVESGINGISGQGPHNAEELARNCAAWQTTTQVINFCKVLSSFSATGSQNADRIEVVSAKGGPPINLTLTALGGNDTVVAAGTGTHSLSGGGGTDLFQTGSPGPDSAGVFPQIKWNIDLELGTAIPSADASTMSLSGFENVSASSPPGPGSTVRGSSLKNLLTAGAGDDVIEGRDEDDIMQGYQGSDNMSGGGDDDLVNAGAAGQPESDTLSGGTGDDELVAGGGDDTLTGGPGDDTFDCGPGVDLVTDNVIGEELIDCEVPPAELLPDASIRRSKDIGSVGENVYEATPSEEQTVSWSAKKGQTRTFVITLDYDGSGSGPMAVDGCGSNSKFSVKYFAGISNVTEEVADGTYMTAPLGEFGTTIELRAKPKKSSGKLTCDVTGSSEGERDAVRAKLTAKK